MSIPKVGSQVTVVVRNFVHKPVFVTLWDDWTIASPETSERIGTVVRSDSWMKSDEFNLTTGQPYFPIRTISMKNVVSMDGVLVVQKPADKVETKIIKGSKGNEYTVTLTNDVAEKCTCPAFIYRGGRCKHLAIASAKDA